jgi:hypothetical protein
MLGFFIVGCGQNQESPKHAGEGDSVIEKGSKMVEQEVSQIKESIAKQADEMIDKTKVEAEAIKDKTTAITKELIASAYTLLDQGKYAEAISSAQNVLSNYNSASQEANGIITKAKEKLQAREVLEAAAAEKTKETLEAEAAEKAREVQEATVTEKAESIKEDLTKKLKSFGQ